jgi:peptidyl-tRNA hydrolase, PTH1 family
MILVVGLGNPGRRYERTRHNAGFLVVDALARSARNQDWSMQSQSLVTEIVIAGQQVKLAKPTTYMNASGQAVRLLLDDYRLDWKDLIVVLDDLDLPLGRIRIRERGSAGGHHGAESIIRMIGCDEFIRVRLGIGEEKMPVEKAEFVLSEVSPGKAAEWAEMIARAAGAVQSIVADGASRAMSMFNA